MADVLFVPDWQTYDALGYLKLGPILDARQLGALQQRIDDIMLGTVTYPGLQFQLDTGGLYEDLPDAVADRPTATLGYRKIQGLEADPMVLEIIQRPVFREICARHYGRHAGISIFRAMMMNKPAGKGTYLPWHQDAGDVWKLDRDPLVTIWIALDAATRENGCVQVIPGTHHLGLLTKRGSTLGPDDIARHCPDASISYLEAQPGEAYLLHNWLLHRSDVNQTNAPRRALTACYMDGRTRNTLTGQQFPFVFREPDEEWPFLRHLIAENQHFRGAAAESERYALSLAAHAKGLEETRAAVEQRVTALEDELARLRGAAAGSPSR